MRFPDFFIIGAAKSGTTSLYSQLKACPSVFLASPKEPEFFARDDLYSQGFKSYSDLYRAANKEQICGEASTIYTLTKYFPETPYRISLANADAKLIYMLRNPVERCFSMYQEIIKHYQNATGDYKVHRNFEEFMYPDRFPHRAPREKVFADFDVHYIDDPEFIIDGSDYLKQIEAYLQHFDRHSIKFILFEDYRDSRKSHLKSVLDFIGANSEDAELPSIRERQNTSRVYFEKRNELRKIENFKKHYFDPKFVTRALPASVSSALRRLFLTISSTAEPTTSAAPTPMQHDTRRALQERFEPTYAEIERITGLDLNVWRNRTV
jgi:Sulfotransferase domain